MSGYFKRRACACCAYTAALEDGAAYCDNEERRGSVNTSDMKDDCIYYSEEVE